MLNSWLDLSMEPMPPDEQANSDNSTIPEADVEGVPEPVTENALPDQAVQEPIVPVTDEEPVHHIFPENKDRNPLKIASTLLVVAINVAVLGASTYLYFKPVAAASLTPTSTNKTKSTLKVDSSSAGTDVTTTKPKLEHYTSSGLGLEFDYPTTWRISSSSDNKSVSLTSSIFSVKEVDGKTNGGKIQVTIDYYPDFSLSPDDPIGANSEKVDYTSPTPAQRPTTFLSFGSYSQTFTGSDPQFSYVFISGNQQYKKGDTVGSKNYKSVQPHISMYIDTCTGYCQAMSAATISSEVWKSEPMFQQFLDIIKSLRLT